MDKNDRRGRCSRCEYCVILYMQDDPWKRVMAKCMCGHVRGVMIHQRCSHLDTVTVEAARTEVRDLCERLLSPKWCPLDKN